MLVDAEFDNSLFLLLGPTNSFLLSPAVRSARFGSLQRRQPRFSLAGLDNDDEDPQRFILLKRASSARLQTTDLEIPFPTPRSSCHGSLAELSSGSTWQVGLWESNNTWVQHRQSHAQDGVDGRTDDVETDCKNLRFRRASSYHFRRTSNSLLSVEDKRCGSFIAWTARHIQGK